MEIMARTPIYKKKAVPGVGRVVVNFTSKRSQRVSSPNRLVDSVPDPVELEDITKEWEQVPKELPKEQTLFQKIIGFIIVFFNLQK